MEYARPNGEQTETKYSNTIISAYLSVKTAWNSRLRCIERTPLAAAVRILLERTLASEFINDIFERNARQQYTKQLQFADIVTLMGTVVQRVHPSVHAAFKKLSLAKYLTITSFYEKLNGIEPQVSAALVSEHADRVRAIIDHLEATLPPLVSGYATRVLDGNALAATEHRLDVLRDTRSGPLPGKSLVIFDYERDLIAKMIPCEDGHTQERALSDEWLCEVQENDLWIADHNFYTQKILTEISARNGKFLIREHRNIPLVEETDLETVVVGRPQKLQEQRVRIDFHGVSIQVRRIWLTMAHPTRDGDREIVVLTTLPKEIVSAERAMELYKKRWTLETMFAELTTAFRCEINALGYPRAALFAFAPAIVSANTLATLRAALRIKIGLAEEETISSYHLIEDLQSSYRGMDLLVGDDIDWKGHTSGSLVELVALLMCIIGNFDLRHYRKAKTRSSTTKKSERESALKRP